MDISKPSGMKENFQIPFSLLSGLIMRLSLPWWMTCTARWTDGTQLSKFSWTPQQLSISLTMGNSWTAYLDYDWEPLS